MLDLVSNGRVEFGIGEGATRLELGGFNIPAKREARHGARGGRADRQHDGDGALSGLRGRARSRCPAATCCPSRVQKPHPPMWMACTNRDTIKVAASTASARWPSPSSIRRRRAPGPRSTTTSSRATRACRSATRVNANIAMVSAFSLHRRPRRGDRGAGRRASSSSAIAINALVAQRRRARPLAAVGASSRSSARRRASSADRCRHRGPVGADSSVARHRHAGRHPRAPALVPRPPASTRSSSCSRPAATGTSTSASRSSCSPPRCCPSSRPQAEAERERRKAEELAPYIERRWRARTGMTAARRRRHSGRAGLRRQGPDRRHPHLTHAHSPAPAPNPFAGVSGWAGPSELSRKREMERGHGRGLGWLPKVSLVNASVTAPVARSTRRSAPLLSSTNTTLAPSRSKLGSMAELPSAARFVS